MKIPFRASVFFGIFLFLNGMQAGFPGHANPCALSQRDLGPNTHSSPTLALPGMLPTISFLNSTATPASPNIHPTPTQAYVQPTLIPTIDPTLVPGLLSKAFSIQTIESTNGRQIRKITGWDYGFRRCPQDDSCQGYDWLDASHRAGSHQKLDYAVLS